MSAVSSALRPSLARPASESSRARLRWPLAQSSSRGAACGCEGEMLLLDLVDELVEEADELVADTSSSSLDFFFRRFFRQRRASGALLGRWLSGWWLASSSGGFCCFGRRNPAVPRRSSSISAFRSPATCRGNQSHGQSRPTTSRHGAAHQLPSASNYLLAPPPPPSASNYPFPPPPFPPATHKSRTRRFPRRSLPPAPRPQHSSILHVALAINSNVFFLSNEQRLLFPNTLI